MMLVRELLFSAAWWALEAERIRELFIVFLVHRRRLELDIICQGKLYTESIYTVTPAQGWQLEKAVDGKNGNKKKQILPKRTRTAPVGKSQTSTCAL